MRRPAIGQGCYALKAKLLFRRLCELRLALRRCGLPRMLVLTQISYLELKTHTRLQKPGVAALGR